MKSLTNKIDRVTLILLIVLIPTALNIATAAEPKRIALLPFKINAEKDMSFLQNGIFDMLTSRLSQQGAVEVIGRQAAENAVKALGGPDAVNESAARKIGSQLNADYTLFGSLTVFGDSISIDAAMVDVSGNTPAASFSEQSQDLGGVITKVNQIAAEINTKIFNRQPTVAQQAASAPQTAKAAPKDDTHAHPEKLLKSGGPEGEGSPFIMQGEAEGAFQNFWRSARFKHVINGIAIGDVDRDGKIETVVVTPHSVIVYRSESGKFYKAIPEDLAEHKTRINIGVDIADINANGYPEIFVSCLNGPRTSLASYVLEFDGKGFNTIVADSRWYYRVAKLPGRGKILLGQRHNHKDPFSAKIYDMIWQNSEYVPENDIKAGREANLLGFTIGAALNDRQDVSIAYRQNDHIQLLDSAGKELWRSGEPYGGSTLFAAGEKDDRGGAVINLQYYPMRLLVADTNADGDAEVIVVKNYELARMKLERFRKFTNAHIEALTWDGLGLSTRWKTRKISGFIRDYAVGDFDNDGKIELIAAVILDEGRTVLISEPQSTIIAYEMPS